MGADVNWISPGGSDNPEFLHELNRMEWLARMAWENGISQAPPNTPPRSNTNSRAGRSIPTSRRDPFSKDDQDGWLLDSSLRVESWNWAYFVFLNHPNFTGREDSLFLYKLAAGRRLPLRQCALRRQVPEFLSRRKNRIISAATISSVLRRTTAFWQTTR